NNRGNACQTQNGIPLLWSAPIDPCSKWATMSGKTCGRLTARRVAATRPSTTTTRPIRANRVSTIATGSSRRRRRRDCISTEVTGGSAVTGMTSLGRLRRDNRRQVERRTRRVDCHQLVDHGFAAREARELIATHRVLRRVEQAFVAVGARPLGQVAAHAPLLPPVLLVA